MDFYIALDLETTGLNPNKDQIIEIAALKIKKDGTQMEVFHSLVNPGVPIPYLVQNLTGIRNEDVQHAPNFEKLKKNLGEFINEHPILGHSVQFDIDFLNGQKMNLNNPVLDTLELAQILLFQEKSYSLEILSEKYGLTHESKHRAEDDAKVSIELYKMLVEKIRTIPNKTAQKCIDILKKTNWPWAETFLEHFNKGVENQTWVDKKTTQKSFVSPKKFPEHLTILKETIRDAWATNENILIEEKTHTFENIIACTADLAEQSGEHAVIATHERIELHKDDRIAILHHPKRYLCLERFEKFLKKDHFESPEMSLILKILIRWPTLEIGEKHEFNVNDREEKTWDQLCALNHIEPIEPKICSHTECFYTKALKNAHYKPIVVISHSLLIENSVRNHALVPAKPHLIIQELENLKSSALWTLTQFFTRETFHGPRTGKISTSLDILFGLFGILFEKHEEKKANRGNLIITEELWNSPEGQKIKGMLENLEAQIQEESGPSSLKYAFSNLQKTLRLNPKLCTWIALSPSDQPILRCCPIEIKACLHQEVWNHEQHWIGMTHSGSMNETFAYLKNQLGIPSEAKEKLIENETDPHLKKTLAPILQTHLELPSIYHPSNDAQTARAIEKILEKEKTFSRCAFLLVNSKKAASALHTLLKEGLAQHGIDLLGEGLSGGMGKIEFQFKKKHTDVLVIGTHRLFETFLKWEESTNMNLLLIHRLPFFPSNHPVEEYEFQQYKNGFMEYVLLEAILRFKKILWLFENHFKKQGCSPDGMIHMLDPRFENYNGAFGKILNS